MIEVKNLTKRYGSVRAVNDISFTVSDGGVYGFLGPNGAGKSTTMNIITGCLAASSGSVSGEQRDPCAQQRGRTDTNQSGENHDAASKKRQARLVKKVIRKMRGKL